MATLALGATADPASSPPSVVLQVVDTGTPAVSSVTILRLDPDGRYRKVRTSDDGPLLLSGGTASLVDYEVPLGSRVTYKVDQANLPTVDAVVDSDVPWLVNPGSPARSMPLSLRKGSNDSELWATDRGVFQVLGRPTPVVITGGTRAAAASSLLASTGSLSELTSLASLLADGGALLLNVPPQLGLGIATAYISIGDVTVTRPSDIGTQQMRDITMPYQVVDRPVGGTQAGLTWLDVAARYATWSELAAAVPSWAALAGPRPDSVAVYPSALTFPGSLYPGG